jgi:hypothetical protein
LLDRKYILFISDRFGLFDRFFKGKKEEKKDEVIVESVKEEEPSLRQKLRAKRDKEVQEEIVIEA